VAACVVSARGRHLCSHTAHASAELGHRELLPLVGCVAGLARVVNRECATGRDEAVVANGRRPEAVSGQLLEEVVQEGPGVGGDTRATDAVCGWAEDGRGLSRAIGKNEGGVGGGAEKQGRARRQPRRWPCEQRCVVLRAAIEPS
jgi:hypothetical protein